MHYCIYAFLHLYILHLCIFLHLCILYLCNFASLHLKQHKKELRGRINRIKVVRKDSELGPRGKKVVRLMERQRKQRKELKSFGGEMTSLVCTIASMHFCTYTFCTYAFFASLHFVSLQFCIFAFETAQKGRQR